MIFIVLSKMFSCVADKEGYYYRRTYPADNPLVKASNIEYMPESEQLELFQKIDKEGASLYVFGADGDSLLREIFIKPHLDEEGYIRYTDTYTPIKTEYNGISFEYTLTYSAEREESPMKFKVAQDSNDMDSIVKSVLFTGSGSHEDMELLQEKIWYLKDNFSVVADISYYVLSGKRSYRMPKHIRSIERARLEMADWNTIVYDALILAEKCGYGELEFAAIRSCILKRTAIDYMDVIEKSRMMLTNTKHNDRAEQDIQ